jgi:hypothetical protein
MNYRLILFWCLSCALTPSNHAEVALFPMGGQQGSEFETEVIGDGFDGAHDVVFDCDTIQGEVRTETEDDETRVFIRIKIDPAAVLGPHVCRVLTSQGLSEPLILQVNTEPAVTESDKPHSKPGKAQPLEYPVVVNGVIREAGEVDFYAIEVEAGEELMFEVITPTGLIFLAQSRAPALMNDAELALYKAGESWFGSGQPMRVEPTDESLVYYFPARFPAYSMPIHIPRMKYKFEEAGWYLFEVTNVRHHGGPTFNYQLRIVRSGSAEGEQQATWTPRKLSHEDTTEWNERDYRTTIAEDWMDRIRARSINDGNVDQTGKPLTILPETEPNSESGEATTITLPLIVKGAIDPPGDLDYYNFKIDAAKTLVFEIRTPDVHPPDFSPRLTVTDKEGARVFDNIYRKVGGDGDDWDKTVEPKIVYAFDKPGTYTVEIQDLTSRQGGENYRYDLVVRPQIPHVGEMSAFEIKQTGRVRYRTQHLNLKIGQAEKLSIVAEMEEGFKGEAAIVLENLPPGVRTYTASSKEPDVELTGGVYEHRGQENKELYRPERLINTIMLFAVQDEAEPTTTPQQIQLKAIPVVNGKSGEPFLIQEIPLMVVN